MITNLLGGRLLLVRNNLLQRQLLSIWRAIFKSIKTCKSLGALYFWNDLIGEVLAASLRKVTRLMKSVQL